MSISLFGWLRGCGFSTPLLAEKSPWQAFGDRFRAENTQFGSSDLVAAVVVIGVGAATFWLLASYLRRSERPKTIDNPRKLFNELCRAHGLERHDVAQLRSIAEAVPLENPSLLFVDPGLLDAAILDPRWSEASAELSRYRELLFGEEDGTQAATAEAVRV